jgi:hypothetical protein
MNSTSLLDESGNFSRFLPHRFMTVFVKVRVKIKFTLEQGHEGPEGSIYIWLYTSFNLGARWGRWSTPRSGRFTPGEVPVPIV